MNQRPSCPAAACLHEHLEAGLPQQEAAILIAHLDSCECCRDTLEQLAVGNKALLETARALGEERPSSTPAMRGLLDHLKGQERATAASEDMEPDTDIALSFLTASDKPGLLGCLESYGVAEIIGRGGKGVVLRAFDPALNRTVAIKVMAPQLASSPKARKRFQREAQAAACVRDEHVIDIYAIGETNGLPYLVMECVRGKSLQEYIDVSGHLELKEILRIGVQVATGLAAAHAQGLIHRDVKPANILLENGVERVKITDFGLARAADDVRLTQSGVVAGTPDYMAPEQASGEAVDHRTDLFSLGSVLYAMCTGQRPFRAENTLAILRRITDDVPQPIQQINANIPGWFCAVVAKLHAKDPAQRFGSAGEVAELLGHYLAHLEKPGESPMPTVLRMQPPSSPRWSKRRKILVGIAAAVLLVTAAAAVPGIIVRIKDKQGRVTEVKVPEGASVEITQDGKVGSGGPALAKPADVPFAFKPPPPGPVDRLDPAKIPAAERFPWQAKELVAVFGEHRQRHWDGVECVAYSRDGKRIASGDNNRVIRVWNAETMREQAVLRGHTGGCGV